MSDFWSEQRVMVTGAAGFIGSHIMAKLKADGVKAWGVDRQYSSTWNVLGLNGQALIGRGLNDMDEVRKAFAFVKPSVVLHVAGMSHIGHCQKNPGEAFTANVTLTANVLEACKEYRVKSAVFASSNHVYGSMDVKGYQYAQYLQGYKESEALRPSDIYGATKAAGDILVTAAAREGWPFVALRHVNAYGPADPHLDHLIPYTILRYLAGEKVELRSDGSPRKGYLHISDIVEAYLLLAQEVALGSEHGVSAGAYNCGPDEVSSVIEIVRTVNPEAVLTLWLSGKSEQAGYTEILDSTKLKKIGWVPRIGLPLGIAATKAWFREHPKWPNA